MLKHIIFLGNGKDMPTYDIHFEDIFSDHTLCGETLDGDPETCGDYEETVKKVNCVSCIAIITKVKSIKRSEYK